MKTLINKLPVPILAAASCLMLQACAGAEFVVASTLVANPASAAVASAMMPVTAEATAKTGLFDGINTPKQREDGFANLDRAAQEASARAGTELSRPEAVLLAVLSRNGQSGLKEIARESRLTRAEVMTAIKRLESMHLIWIEHKVTDSGPFIAALTPIGADASAPFARLFIKPEFLGANGREQHDFRMARLEDGGQQKLN